jgi:hypothetical protein
MPFLVIHRMTIGDVAWEEGGEIARLSSPIEYKIG